MKNFLKLSLAIATAILSLNGCGVYHYSWMTGDVTLMNDNGDTLKTYGTSLLNYNVVYDSKNAFHQTTFSRENIKLGGSLQIWDLKGNTYWINGGIITVENFKSEEYISYAYITPQDVFKQFYEANVSVVEAPKDTTVSIVGQSGEVVEMTKEKALNEFKKVKQQIKTYKQEIKELKKEQKQYVELDRRLQKVDSRSEDYVRIENLINTKEKLLKELKEFAKML